jgi:hypothetical protein
MKLHGSRVPVSVRRITKRYGKAFEFTHCGKVHFLVLLAAFSIGNPKIILAQHSNTTTYSITNQEPITNVVYPNALTSKPLPKDVLSHLMQNSDIIAQTALNGNGSTSSSLWGTSYLATPGTNDFNVASVYYAGSNDPTYCITSCRITPSGSENNPIGHCFHAPSGAQFDGYPNTGDENLIVWDQTQNRVLNAYSSGVQNPSLPTCQKGQTCNVSFNYCAWADRTKDDGYGNNPVYTNGLSPEAGTIRGLEIVQGAIHHAVYLNAFCTNGDVVFPNLDKASTALRCDQVGKSDANRPPNGSLFFLDYTPQQISSMTNVPAWQKTILLAISTYGAYLGDTGGSADTLHLAHLEGGQAYQYSGVTDPLWTYLNSHCTSPACTIAHHNPPASSTVYTMNVFANIPKLAGPNCQGSSCGVDKHLHIADPCIAKGLAGFSGTGGACF